MLSPAVRDQDEKIAIVGMGCRFPGGAGSPDELWRLLAEGRDAVTERPAGRLELCGAGDEQGSAALRHGGFLPDVTGFDAEFFGVSAREADVVDPQHRLLLEVAWEALDHAGMPPDRLDGTATGVFAGLSYTEYMERLGGQPEELEGSVLSNGSCVAGGRISYLLGLSGPCMVLDTACSSSLVAVHLAAQALRLGECDTALAGGVSLILSPRMTRSFERLGMLSRSGRCRAFDAAADGFVRGEGCGMVVLRRLADALADGNRVLAVLRGSAVNSDGRSDGLTAPSPEAQRALMRLALERSGTLPGDVGMIEAHGTGTPVGDPVEFASLAEVYGDGPAPCALTSVKTNLGHLEPAAGISGLIKAVLCLRRGQVPPNLHFSRWNPRLSAERTRFFVPTEMTSWPAPGRPRIAAVSSFGFSGTNAHVLLEEAPRQPGPAPASAAAASPMVFTIPAGSREALPAAADRLADWLAADGATVPLPDVGYTLSCRRSRGRGRLGVVAGSASELASGLRSFAAGQVHPRVVSGEVGNGIVRQPAWVFSGQGSQWAGMGATLLSADAAFAAALAEASELMKAETGFSVLDAISSRHPVVGCNRVQPALFAMQYALAAMWRAHGVEPACVIGHSMGEVAAAVVAGALSLSDGVRVIARRSALLSRIAGAGAMASVELDAARVEAELARAGTDGSASVAVLAAPRSTGVAGASAEVTRLVADWEARGIPARLIAVDVASHCAQVDPLLGDLAEALAGLRPRVPEIPFYSTVTPGKRPAFDAAYWCANLRRPVQFSAAITAAASGRRSVYIEVSPHPVVARAISDSLVGLVADPVVLPTLRRDEDDLASFRTQLAAGHCAGVAVDWSALYPDGQLADVPPITFSRRRHWVDVPAREPAPQHGSAPATLPGQHTEVPGDRLRHSWHGDAGTGVIPWLADHQVHGRSVLPGAMHAALALSTACEAFGAGRASIEIRSLRLHQLFRLGEHAEIKTILTRTGDDSGEWETFGRDEADGWTRLASASVRRVTATEATAGPRVAAAPAVPDILGSPAGLYDGMRCRGIEHGPAFLAITGLDTSGDGQTIWARVELPEAAGPSGLRVHPVLLDACAQALTTFMVQGPGNGLILPTGVTRMTMPGDPATASYARVRITDVRADGVTGDACLLDTAGRVVFLLEGMELTQSAGDNTVDRWFFEPTWSQAPIQAGRQESPSGTWLICADAAADSQALATALRAAGATTEIECLPGSVGPLDDLAATLGGRWAGRPAPGALVLLPSREVADANPAAALTHVRRLLGVAQAAIDSWARPPRLYAVTLGAQRAAEGDRMNLADGGIHGVIRVLACEQPGLRATQVDVAPAAAGLAGLRVAALDGHDSGMRALAGELLGDHPDEEVALRDCGRYLSRLEHAPLTGRERSTPAIRAVRYGHDRFKLQAGRLGELRSLQLVAAPRRPLAPGEVELRVQAAGMNFRDVLTVMGLLGDDEDARTRIGFECAGVVTATGPGVTHVQPGDRALGFDTRGGSFGSFVTMPAASVTALPDRLAPMAAAGIPAAFLTAWYALRHVARLQPSEQVLIHSATGGTGQAAIAVARLLGADVLATAGSDAKRHFLRDQGIKHVMDSRSLDFVAQVREVTGGEGVDVVLNSLVGPAIRAGLETLRPFGRFVELGVRDILADAPLGMLPLRHNITLGTVDLAELQLSRPGFFATLLDEVVGMFRDGQLAPLPGLTFTLEEAADAFALMAGAGHIGKIVLSVPDDGHATAVIPGVNPARTDGAYIITGGLTGVGLATARWLALGGAGQVIVNGRRSPSQEAEQVLAEMRAAGCRVTVVTGDIAEPGTARRLVEAVTGDGIRLRGVAHAAMVLDDAAIPNITEAQLRRVWLPKVAGAWHLHQATVGRELDWFALYSSMTALVGNPGQGAYAAANSWLDAFAAWRAGHGLPALAVNWGPWGQTGVATNFAERGYQTIPTDDGLRALGSLLTHGRLRTGVLPGPPDSWIPAGARASTLLSGLASAPGGTESGAPGSDARAELAATPPGLARRNALESYLAGHIRTVLGLGHRLVDPDTPLRSLGFDSLLSIELSCRLESGLGIKLGPKFVWTYPTLAELTDAIAGRLDAELANDRSS
jgi:polyketide synthase 2/polyketide synthase 5